MSRARTNDFPKYMYAGDRDDFIVRNPANGKKIRFRDEEEARRYALGLGELIEKQRHEDALNAGRPTVAYLIKRWLAEEFLRQPWSAGTRANAVARLGRIERELGERHVSAVQGHELQSWLRGITERGDLFNQYRAILLSLWRYAVLHKWVSKNEAEKVPEESTSKKLVANRKSRQQLDMAGFTAIHAKAPPWLQVAMELSLKTLLSRREIVNMRFADFRNGHLFTIRQKVAGVSDMGFIKIAVDEELDDLRRRGLTLGQLSPTVRVPVCVQAFDLYEAGVPRGEIAQRFGSTPERITQLICHERKRRAALTAIVSPYVIHYRPERRTRTALEAKPHWTYVTPGHLSNTFAEAVEATGLWANLPAGQTPPSFHEIRGLGSRRMLELLIQEGVPAKQARERVGALLTHSQPKTTAIYLEKGAEGLSDADYVPVSTVSIR